MAPALPPLWPVLFLPQASHVRPAVFPIYFLLYLGSAKAFGYRFPFSDYLPDDPDRLLPHLLRYAGPLILPFHLLKPSLPFQSVFHLPPALSSPPWPLPVPFLLKLISLSPPPDVPPLPEFPDSVPSAFYGSARSHPLHSETLPLPDLPLRPE